MLSAKKIKRGDSQLSYTKIHVPKMKSVFWKYFGFPSDDNDEIITKQKVICTLCHAVLTNHCNTTNIRAHIQSTHKAIFAELIETHGISVPPRRVQKKTARRPLLVQCSREDIILTRSVGQQPIKHEALNCSSSSVTEEDCMNILEDIPLTYEDTDRISTNAEMADDAQTSSFIEQSNNNETVSPARECIKSKSPAPLNINFDINPIQLPIECDVEEVLRKMIVKDLRNVSSIYSCAMQEFITGFLSNPVLPPLSKMESSIRCLHNEKFTTLRERIRVHSQVKLYSLSFDVWTNIEDRQFASIYFNSISEEFENRFCDDLYMTIELNDYTMFDQVFDEFNLENCSAAIVNSNNKILNTFLSNTEIPIVHCFSYIVNTCIDDVFSIPDVLSILAEVQDVIARYAPQICSEDIEIPSLCKEFPLTKVAILKFFCESVSWPEELDFLIAKAKHILDVLTPLEVTLETLKEEDIPLSSLFLPFANKIIERHFILRDYDDVMLQEIKSRVIGEFKRSVCSNKHLTITALLDPRFHKFLSIKNINACVNILEKKYTHISKQSGYLDKCEALKEDTQKNSRKSHLKLFFDCLDTPPVAQLSSGKCIEKDLRRYREEAFASLEESPLLWWSQWGNMYGSLKHLANAYNCILGFVNMSFKDSLKDQISFHRKRFVVTGKLIDQIVFLNKNYSK